METITVHNVASRPPKLAERERDVCCPTASPLPAADDTQILAMTDRLKALADETRLRVLDLLIQHSEALCVCDITAQFNLRQPTISHHLRLLREAALIRAEKHGTWMYYSATDEGKRCISLARSLI